VDEGATTMADALLTDIEGSPPTADPVAERRRRAERLVELAGRKRRPLEALRNRFVERLHAPGPDFAATEALRTVEVALSATPRPEEAQRAREEALSRHWWHRWMKP
jgi:hypothetical protein